MTTFLPMVRATVRSLLGRPVHTVVSILTLATAICLWLVTFASFHGRFMSELPLSDADELLMIAPQTRQSSSPLAQSRVEVFEFLRDHAESFERLAGYRTLGLDVSGVGGPPERAVGAAVSREFFATLGVQPILGRAFRDEEFEGGMPVALISYRFWQKHFAGDQRGFEPIQIRIYDRPTMILGVLPEGFHFPYNHDVWTPLIVPMGSKERQGLRLSLIGRLASDVSRDQCAAELGALAGQIEDLSPVGNETFRFLATPFVEAHSDPRSRLAHSTLVGVVSVVCAMAALCVAGLTLIHVSRRSAEFALRVTLGARWTQLFALLLMESALLSMGGTALGWVGAKALLRVQHAWLVLPPGGYWEATSLSSTVVAASILLAVALAMIGGLIPMAQIRWGELAETLRGFSRLHSAPHSRGLASRLVTSLIAMAMPLVAVSGLIVQNLHELEQRELTGWPTDALTAQVSLSDKSRATDAQRFGAFQALESELRREPGVADVGLIFPALPGDPALMRSVTYRDPGTSDERDVRVAMSIVTPGFFRIFGLRPIEGRHFETVDSLQSLPVVVVNRSFASRHFGEASPLLREIRVGGVWRRVVGVVDDFAMSGVGGTTDAGVYIPLSQVTTSRAWFVAATHADPSGLVRRAPEIVARSLPASPVYLVQTMTEYRRRILADQILARTLSSVFGALAVLLTLVALFGLLASRAVQRRRELTIRSALGATPSQLRRLVMVDGLILLVWALPFGLLFSVWGGRLVASVVPDGAAWSLSSFLVMLSTIGLAVLGASALPAFWATSSLSPSTLRD